MIKERKAWQEMCLRRQRLRAADVTGKDYKRRVLHAWVEHKPETGGVDLPPAFTTCHIPHATRHMPHATCHRMRSC